MCVMLFANPKVYSLLDLPAAISYRQSLQCSLAPATRSTAVDDIDVTEEAPQEIEASKVPRVMKRSAWLQTYFCRLAEQSLSVENQPLPLAEDWRHDAFEAIAHAWARLLSLFGLRR